MFVQFTGRAGRINTINADYIIRIDPSYDWISKRISATITIYEWLSTNWSTSSSSTTTENISDEDYERIIDQLMGDNSIREITIV